MRGAGREMQRAGVVQDIVNKNARSLILCSAAMDQKYCRSE